MNSDVYIFGKFGVYTSQYPDDFASEIFKKMGEWDTSADTYVSVHRKGELMYYGYVRKLGWGHYIGFCFVLNGLMVTDFNVLFEISDRMIHHLAVSGEILKYSDSGNLVSNTLSLVYGKPVLNQIRALLKEELSGLSDNLKGLPPESYGISVSESKQFDLNVDDMPQIVSASWKYGYTFIAKDSGTPAPDSYQGVLCRLHRKKKELEATNEDLLAQIIKLDREKKQQGVVLAVSFAAIICFYILLGVKHSLNETQGELALSQKKQENTQTELNQTKDNLDRTKKKSEDMRSSFLGRIAEKDRQINSLQQENEQLILKQKILKQENDRLSGNLKNIKNELQQVKAEYRESMKTVSQNSRVQSQSAGYTSRNSCEAISIINAPLRKECSHTAPIIVNIPKYSSIEVFLDEHKNGYYKVKYKQTVGYLAEVFIKFKQ